LLVDIASEVNHLFVVFECKFTMNIQHADRQSGYHSGAQDGKYTDDHFAEALNRFFSAQLSGSPRCIMDYRCIDTGIQAASRFPPGSPYDHSSYQAIPPV
jgi:hypothetical protein